MVEFRDLEDLLHNFQPDLNLPDAPVEYAVLFRDRLEEFLKDYVLGGQNLLGEIDHNVNRRENQVRPAFATLVFCSRVLHLFHAQLPSNAKHSMALKCE